CVDRLRLSGADGLEPADRPRRRLRHRRLRRVLFRRRYFVAGRGCGDPEVAADVRGFRRDNRSPQPGAGPSLVSAKAWPALPAAVILNARYRPLPDEEHAGRNPPHVDGYEVYAPHGFDDIANLIVRPNPGANSSAANYAAKAARWKSLWPEITVLPAEA